MPSTEREPDLTALRELEEALWRAETRFDRRFMDATLAPDFEEFGRSGRRYSRADVLETPEQPIDAALPLEGFVARLVGGNVAIVTYISEVRYDRGERANRTSIWRWDGERWVLEFHQGTPA